MSHQFQVNVKLMSSQCDNHFAPIPNAIGPSLLMEKFFSDFQSLSLLNTHSNHELALQFPAGVLKVNMEYTPSGI
jgi:hypothetical protein